MENRSITVGLPEDLLERAEEIAHRHKLTLTALIQQALAERIAGEEAPSPQRPPAPARRPESSVNWGRLDLHDC